MKSLIPAAMLALLLHGLFLFVPPEWRPGRSKPLLRPRPVTMTFSYRAPAKPAVSSAETTPAIRKPPAPASPKRLKNETKPPISKPRPKIRKREKKKVRPRPAAGERPPASPPPRLAASTEKEVTGETAAISDTPFPKGIRPFSPKAVPQGQGLQGRHKTAPDSAPPPLVEAIPVYRENPAPRYPRTARRRGYEGAVLLEVLVNREGKVKELRIFRSSGYPVLDKAALSSVKKWIFEPGKRGDESIEMWVKIPVSFRLK